MIESKYGFSIGEKVLFTYSSGCITTFTIESFDREMWDGVRRERTVCFTTGAWDYIDRISKLYKSGEQLLFNFM